MRLSLGLGLAALVSSFVLFAACPARAAEDVGREPGQQGSDATATTSRPEVSAERPADGTDIVETIEEPGVNSGSAAPPPPGMESAAATSVAPATADRLELNGWARQSLELGFSTKALRESEPVPGALPYDRLTSRTQLFARARYSKARWFEANVSGAVSYSFYEQGTEESSKAFNGFNGQSARGVVEPRLHELFVGFFTPKFDLRVGQQRLAWGRGDFVSPNDVMNARDLRDPFVGETELRTIPTFLIRADVDLGFGSLQGVIAPVFAPDRFDVSDSNWSAIQPRSPLWMRGLAGIARHSLNPTLQEQAQRLLSATRYPKGDLTEPVLGARFAWSAGGIDVSHYYQYGYDGPLVSIDPQFRAALNSFDWSQVGLADLQPVFAAIDAGQEPIRARYVRRHHVGLDAATTIGPFALRVDTAYQSRRVFFKRDLTGVLSPGLQGVLSIEYQTFDKNKLLLLEGIYLRVMDTLREPLLIYRLDSFAIAGTVRWPVWRSVGVDVRAILGVQPRTLILQPELTFKPEPIHVSIGGLWLDGALFSLASYYERNREIYAKAKYYF